MRNILLAFFCLISIQWAYSQILDDSTKQIYGFHSTKYTTEYELYSNRKAYYTVDTSINNFHRYNFTYYPEQSYQNLGVLGSASKPIWWEQPTQIGVRLGMNALDQYVPNASKVKYFDTKSPYSSLYYVQCRGCEEVMNAEISRNVNKNLNIGFQFNRMIGLKQLAASGSPNRDKMTDHISLVLYASFKSKNERYHLLANYSHFNHYILENGGIRPETGDTANLQELIQYQLSKVNLTAAKTWERRNNWHLYQQYDIVKNGKLALFHTGDRLKRKNIYYDDNINYLEYNGDTITAYYPQILYDSAHTYWRNNYYNLENKFGIKGEIRKLWASVFLVHRNFYRDNYYYFFNYDNFSNRVNEYYAGFDARYQLADSFWISIENQFLLKRNHKFVVSSDTFVPNEKDYRTAFGLKYRNIEINYSKVNISPTILESNHQSNFFFWNKDFKSSLSDVVKLKYQIPFKKQQYILAFANYTNVINPIFFSYNGEPEQFLNTNAWFYSLALGGRLKLGKFNIEPLFRYTAKSKFDIYRIPAYWGNIKLFYENRIVKKTLLIQVGIDYFYRFGYTADKYMTITQAFYLGTNFGVNAYNLLDFFVNAQISKARIFFKVSHLNQNVGGNGYFVGPYYSGPRRAIQLGVNWRFFD